MNPEVSISPERPLIILQTSNRFGDSDEDYGIHGSPTDEATKHGQEAVRVWRETLPDGLKPYTQLQLELRMADHAARYERFRYMLTPLHDADIPVDLQVWDIHNPFIFEPAYIEKLLNEFDCIKSLTFTEIRFEQYDIHNVPRYATPPHVRYALDVIPMAVDRGKHVVISLQDLKWLHVCADTLNRPLRELIARCPDHIIPVNEHIGPRLLQRQTSVWGTWLAGIVNQWGIEPQSWWYENARMIEPGLFGQREPDNTRIMPPDLYRAMILLGASMGATVFDFEPFWDLFDYDNSICWRETIAPTLLEVIERKLIPTREQVMEKVKVAYRYGEASSITEFHEILRDIDWIGDEGLLSKAAYGLWGKYLEHELIPNKHRYYFIPLIPATTAPEAVAQFAEVIQTGQCDSVEAYQAVLDRHYPDTSALGDAWVTAINGHVYVFQNHENLYERQHYSVELPKTVTGIIAERRADGVYLTWPEDAGASEYYIHRVDGAALPDYPGFSKTIWKADVQEFADPQLQTVGERYYQRNAGSHAVRPYDPYPRIGTTRQTYYLDETASADTTYVYTVTARTSTKARRNGVVNYLDFVVFSECVSVPGEHVVVGPEGIRNHPFADPEDTRPASQHWYPTFQGVETAQQQSAAEAIVERLDAFKQCYEAMDWAALTALYSEEYRDMNGFSKEYVGIAWKWWFFRNNGCTLLRQIRQWNFEEFDSKNLVHLRLFSLFRAIRYDDHQWGYHYDGTLRLPRHASEEILYTWCRESDEVWRIIGTNPSMPCLQDMLWYSRGSDSQALPNHGCDDRYVR